MTDERVDRVTVDDIMAKLDRGSYGELLHDDQRRRHELYRMMADSTDPTLREMGQQLRDGLLAPRDLLSIPDYVDTLRRGWESLEHIDLDEVADALDEIEPDHDAH